MKTDRLYALTLYLLNHGRTPASELAERFEVSVRTIQRDMDALSRAGIPVYALTGINGGYEISDTFKMNNQLMSGDDFAWIATALKGLKTVASNSRADEIVEKIRAVSDSGDTGIILDFSVLREGGEMLLQTLQSAVLHRKKVRFSYTNNRGETRVHCVEPVAVIYRWYSWYMLAYLGEPEDYRTYKLVRMENACVMEEGFTKDHRPAEEILKECDHSYNSNLVTTGVKLHCHGNAVHRIREYLNGKTVETCEDGSAIMEIHIVENEQWWIGVLLSQGKDIKVLEPESIRNRIVEAAEDIICSHSMPGGGSSAKSW